MTVLWITAAWLAADFLSGFVHWWEDRYGDPSWPLLGRFVVEPNILHHADPTAFLRDGFIGRNWTSMVPAFGIATACWLADYRWLAAVFVLLGWANEVHAWAHQKCSRPVRGLQMLGVLQSQEQHARHHRQPFDRNYCVMSDCVNPILSAVGFWFGVEAAVWWLTGIAPRPERAEA